MKIRTKLSIGFSLIVMVTVISGLFSLHQTQEIYDHSKEANVKNVSLMNATMEMKLAVTTAHLWFEEIMTGAENRETLTQVLELFKKALWYCRAMLEGGKSGEETFYAVDDEVIIAEVMTVEKQIEEFKRLAEIRFDNLVNQQKLEDHLLDEKFDSAFEQLMSTMDKVKVIAQEKIAENNEEVDIRVNYTVVFLTVTILISIFTVFVVIYYSYREIMQEVGGEPQEIAEITRQVAAGNLDLNLNSARTTGIYAAIQLMVKNLKTIHLQQEEQNWLKNGQTQLNDTMRGEQSVIQLAENIIHFVTPYVGAQVGVFYLLNPASESLKLLASYAYTWRKNLANEFKLGEGLVGQAGLERKPIIVTTVPDDYIRIQSGVGESRPAAVLVMPLLYENTLRGVIELASFNQFSEIQLELLKQVASHIAITLNTAESRVRMRELLQQSQTQTEALQQQAEQLQVQQEELQQTNEELQSQSEELQTQQEELRQTNEELEKRTQDLEQQREEIRKKNQVLEETQRVIEAKAQELEIASKYKSEFLANMSHELRTPLNSLLILAQLLTENKEGNLSDKQLEYARTIHSSGFDLLTLINDILDLSKVESGKVEVNVENVVLTELVTETLQKFRPVAEEKGLIFKIMTADHLPAILRTDPQRLKQIINNLLSNAFKFTSQGEVKVIINRPQIEGLGSTANNMIAIHVIDTGIGIPEDKQKIIFEAFQQADGTTSRRYGGTGLGLSISRQLARLLGGEIQVHSQVNQGTTFTFYFPEIFNKTHEIVVIPDVVGESHLSKAIEETLISSQENLFTPPQVEVEQNAEHNVLRMVHNKEALLEDKKVLIVDDDIRNTFALMTFLEDKNMEVIVANNGKEALALLDKHPDISIILMDIMMPEMDGYEAIQKIRAQSRFRKLPIIALTAKAMKGDKSKCIEAGANDYLSKPIDTDRLLSLMRVWLYS